MCSGKEGDSVGPRRAEVISWSSKCKEKNLESQEGRGVRGDRGERVSLPVE